jgi:uncharacterized protein YebE (UPF0316 family)
MSACLVFIALFAIGLFQDALSAFYLRLVSERRIVAASFISVLITFIGYSVLVTLIEQMIVGGLLNVAAYAVGGGVGTYIGLFKKPAAA